MDKEGEKEGESDWTSLEDSYVHELESLPANFPRHHQLR
ncbi:putative protein OS=Streptomyces griseorubiginosus OX=67304 GN=DWG14_00617 PE=4 SV=1 [Streptomyces griseorubiginosus]